LSETKSSGLNGNLDLVCASDPARGSYLAWQSFSAPIHLSKSYWDGETLLVHIVNQTAGFFGGDSIRVNVVVESGACMLLSSPSAARYHPSQGRETRIQQSYKIRAGGSLDVYPEISIPQRDSRSFQKTTIHIEPGGELIYLETLAPGRVASGEAFVFENYSWWTDIHVDDRLVHRERVSLAPRDSSLAGLTALYPNSYYAGIVIISPSAANWDDNFLHSVANLSEEIDGKCAASKLNAHGYSIRLLAADSLALREGILKLRELIYQRLKRRLPNPRRSV
jgi:urease accessory protein